MNSFKLFFATVSCALFSGVVFSADRPVYGEMGYSALRYTGGVQLDFGVVGGSVGAEITKNLDVEGMFMFGVKGDDLAVYLSAVGGPIPAKIDADMDISRVYGFYLKPKKRVSDRVELYGRLGWTVFHTKIEMPYTLGGGRISNTENDFSYGVGAKYAVADKTFIDVGVMNYYSKHGARLYAIGAFIGADF